MDRTRSAIRFPRPRLPSRSSGYAPRRAVARRTSPGTSSPVVSKGGAIRRSCGGGALVRGGRVGGEVCAARLDGGRRVKPEARIDRGRRGVPSLGRGGVPIGSYLSMLMGGDVRGRVNW